MPVFESSRKVQTFGSSLAVTLPSLFVKANEIEKGSIVNVLYGLEGVLVVSSVDDPNAIKGYLHGIMEKLEEKIKSQKIEEEQSPRGAELTMR
ncbi:MAG: AbrB/MazE/SpoVT family DNA-binding domain-containing protein [Candidatus Bathyarchaeia archaeon]